MKNNKKGQTSELGIIIFGLIFITLSNIAIGFILDSSFVDTNDGENTISGYVDSLDVGVFVGVVLTGIITLASLFFSIFGVDFIVAITVLPLWTLGLYALINGIILFALLMYFYDQLTKIVPFT